MLIGTVLIGGAGYLFARLGVRYALSSNLLSCELYGQYGSAVATFIYAFNYIMFFAFEGAIMITAITHYFPGFPRVGIYALFTVFMILLAIYGMRLMTRFMWLTLPIYLIGLIVLFAINPKLGTLSVSAWGGVRTRDSATRHWALLSPRCLL